MSDDNDALSLFLSPMAMVVLPFGVGLAGGALASLAFASILFSLNIHIKYSLIPGSFAGLSAWAYVLHWIIRTSNDINRARVRKAMVIPEQPLLVEKHSADNHTIQRSEIHANYETRYQVAKKVLAGGGLTYDDLKPIFGGNRPAVKQFQLDAVKAGWAEWRGGADNPNQGLRVTESGWTEFKKMVQEGSYLLPPSEVVKLGRVGDVRARTRAHAELAGYTVFDD